MTSKSPSFFVSALITGLVAAGITYLVLLFPWWWGWIPIGIGISVFIFVLLRNPEHWARRMVSSLLGLWTTYRLLPQLPEIALSHDSFFLLINPTNSIAFDCALALLVVCLLAYDAFIRTTVPSLVIMVQRLFSFRWASPSIHRTSGNAQVANVQNVAGPVNIHFAPPPLLNVTDTARVFSSDFKEGSTTAEPVATFDSEIDSIANYLKEERSDVAIELFNRLLKRSSHQLTARHKFRVSANLGQAYEQKEQYDKAARYYLEAVGYQPTDERARCFEAAAHLLLGDRETALKLSIAVLDSFPVSSLAWAIRIRSIPATVPLSDVEQLLPQSVMSEVEVLDALTYRALEENPGQAEAYISKALEVHPNMSHLQERLALAKLHHFDPVRGIYDDPRPLTSKDRGKLREAVVLLDSLINTRQDQGNTRALSRLRYDRGMAHRLLGDFKNAVVDLREAHLLSPSNAEMATRLSFYLWRNHAKEEAISILNKLNRTSPTPSSRWLHSNMLLAEGEFQNSSEAILLLEHNLQDSKSTSEDVASSLETLTEYLCSANRVSEAFVCLKKYEPNISELSRLMIGARVEMAAGNKAFASDQAYKGVDRLTESTSSAELMRSVLTLRTIGDPTRALAVAKRLINPGVYTPAVQLILDLARECEDHSFMLETCQQLREAGIFDPLCLGAELDLLFTYGAPEKGIAVIESALVRCTDVEYKKVLRFRLFQIAAVAERQDLFQTDLNLLPNPETVIAAALPMIVTLLLHANEPAKAVEYAYRALRARPKEANAHKAMLAAVGFGGKPTALGPAPETVEVRCAVRYRPLDTKEDLWCVIEDDPQVDPFIREFAPDSALGKEIVGKRVGDTFSLRRNSVQDREAEILEIKNVFVYRAGDSVEHWEERFPDQLFVQAVRPSVTELGTPDIGILLRQLDIRAVEGQRLDNFYRENVITAAMFARASGSTVPEAVLHLGRQGHLAFRCCRGTDEEVQGALTLLEGLNTCVLDCVALTTIWMTGIYRRLAKCPLQMIVTQGTLKEFRILRAKAGIAGGRGFASKQDGRYVFREMTDDDLRRQESQFDEFEAWLRNSSQATDGLALIDFQPAKRNELIELVGRATAESIATAHKRKCLFWTDDFASAELAQSEIGVGRIWTELVLRWCVPQGYLSEGDYEQSLIDLIAHGYDFTPMFPQLVVAGGQLSEWNPDILPLRRLCEWFGNPNLKAEGLLRLAAQVFLKIWRVAPDISQRRQITRMIAIQIRKHSSGRNVLETLIANVEKIFPIDVLNGEACKSELEAVLQLPNEGSVIVLPW